MENLKLFVTNLKRSYSPVNIRSCVWESFCLQYEAEDPGCRIMIRYIVSSLYLRGARRIESPAPGTIYFFFPVKKSDPASHIDMLLRQLQEDILGFAEISMKIVPFKECRSEMEKGNQKWMKAFGNEYDSILNEIHLLGQSRN